MKILQINNCHFRRGGSEAVYFNTAQSLKEHGHEIVFFSYSDEKNEKTGDKEYFIEWGGTLKKLRNYFYNTDAARKLDEILTIEKPDIVHIHLMWGGINQSIFHVLKKHHVPLVHTAHDYRMVCPGYTFKDGKGGECERCHHWNYYQCAFRRCNKGRLVQSTLMAAEMYTRQIFHNPLNSINGFIFVSHFSEQKQIEHNFRFKDVNRMMLYNYTNPMFEPDVKSKETYFLFYGRLSFEKGLPTLIKTFGQLPDLKLKVVGTGPLEDELKTLCKEKNYENIEFLGYHSGGTLFELVRNAKFVCVPSECYENNPMTIVESYSLGTPVIGSHIGGIPEIIEEGKTGFTFESRSVEELVKCIHKASEITTDDYAAMCNKAYAFYQKNFSVDAHYEKLMAFYNSTIKSFKQK